MQILAEHYISKVGYPYLSHASYATLKPKPWDNYLCVHHHIQILMYFVEMTHVFYMVVFVV